MDQVALTLLLSGLLLSVSGFWTIRRDSISVSSQLLTVLTLGFYWAAIKRTMSEPYAIELSGWKKNLIGLLLLGVGVFSVCGAAVLWSTF